MLVVVAVDAKVFFCKLLGVFSWPISSASVVYFTHLFLLDDILDDTDVEGLFHVTDDKSTEGRLLAEYLKSDSL